MIKGLFKLLKIHIVHNDFLLVMDTGYIITTLINPYVLATPLCIS